MSLEEFKDQLAFQLFGRTRSQALIQGCCVKCFCEVSDDQFADYLSRREYRITGLCQACQGDFFKEYPE